MNDSLDSGIAWRWESFTAVDSTNAVAMEKVREHWARGEKAEGIAVIAARQSAGRGQHGRQWESPAGGLYLSAVVEQVPRDARERLALLAGLAVVEALQEPDAHVDAERARRERWRVAAEIRWPNDVMVDGKKVAGILCEALGQGERWAAVIGIGINVSTKGEALSNELGQRATSLWTHDGRERTIDGLGRAVLRRIDGLLSVLRAQGLGPIVEKVRGLDSLRGKRIQFDAGTGHGAAENEPRAVFAALAEGIDASGALVLRQVAHDGSLGEARAYATGSILAG